MKLSKHIISIYKRSTGEHIIDTYHAENTKIAAYVVAENNFGIPFRDNDEREDYEWFEVELEFNDYGYSVAGLTV